MRRIEEKGVKNKNPHRGSRFNDFLKEEGIYEEVTLSATKRVLIRQIEREMKKQNLTKVTLSKRMKTSRSSLDRLLDPKKPFHISSAIKVATVLGKKIDMRLTA